MMGSAARSGLKCWALVEGYADLLPLAPDDVTGNVRAVCLKDQFETLGDVEGVTNIERRPRYRNVAD
jgi:hypothetical protein